jgi:hypothetical protein
MRPRPGKFESHSPTWVWSPHLAVIILLRDPLARSKSRYQEQRALYNLSHDALVEHEKVAPGSESILKTVQRDGLGCDARCLADSTTAQLLLTVANRC